MPCGIEALPSGNRSLTEGNERLPFDIVLLPRGNNLLPFVFLLLPRGNERLPFGFLYLPCGNGLLPQGILWLARLFYSVKVCVSRMQSAPTASAINFGFRIKIKIKYIL